MTYLYATVAIIGLILCMSEGLYFPALNFAGCLLFAVGMHLTEKRIQRRAANGR